MSAFLAGSPVEHRPLGYSPELVPGAVRVFEIALMIIVALAVSVLGIAPPEEYTTMHMTCAVFVAVVYACVSEWGRLNTLKALMRPLGVLERVVVAVCTSFLLLAALLFGFDVTYMISGAWIWSLLAATVMVLVVARLIIYRFLLMLSRRRIIGRNLAVLGVGAQSARLLSNLLRDPPYFTTLSGVFAAARGETPREIEGVPVLGSIDALLEQVRGGLIDDVIVAMPWNANQVVIDAIERLKEMPVNVYLGADLVDFELAFRPVLGTFSQLPVYEVMQRPISGWNLAFKALLDYSITFMALVVLSPLLLVIAVAIKLDSQGPVLFQQERLGFNNKRFYIYKFRSMYVEKNRSEAVRQATRNDPRVTRVGRIIRTTSLDELPQLMNVLDGTMSLVGPRPHAISHNTEYSPQIRGYFTRHKVKPGITGWAQVNGLRGETSDIDAMRRRIEYDIYYTENWSFIFDIKIIIMTAAVVFFQKKAY